MTSDFEMILSGQKSGFPYTNTYVEFYSDKDYGVRNFHTEKVILFETFEKATKANMKLEAYIVRGFVSSRSSKKRDLIPIVKVDQIFQGLPNHPELTGFYNFIYLD